MIVVSDTSALSALIDIGQTSLLSSLYSEVIIPFEVRDEFLRYHAAIPKKIVVRQVSDPGVVARLMAKYKLEQGECEALALAKEIGSDYLLIDEIRGRTAAKREGLDIIGVVGVLAAAKQEGFIPLLAPILDDLIQSGFFLSPEIVHLVLTRVGERA